MTDLKVLDSEFSWTIDNFKPTLDTIYFSPHFATSVEPHRPWYLYLSVISKDAVRRLTNKNKINAEKLLGLRFVCKETVLDPIHITFDISIISANFEKVYTKSYRICSENDSNIVGYYSFIEIKNLMKWVYNDQLDILVEMFFFKNKEKNKSLKFLTDLKFLSDIDFSIEGQKFHAHKVFIFYFLTIFNYNNNLFLFI